MPTLFEHAHECFRLSPGGTLTTLDGAPFKTPWVFGRGRIVRWDGGHYFAVDVAQYMRVGHFFDLDPVTLPDAPRRSDEDDAAANLVREIYQLHPEGGLLYRRPDSGHIERAETTFIYGRNVRFTLCPKMLAKAPLWLLDHDVACLLGRGHWPWHDPDAALIDPEDEWD